MYTTSKLFSLICVCFLFSCSPESEDSTTPEPTNQIPKTFTISYFAGSTPGYENGNVSKAKFNKPTSIIIDENQNFFIYDQTNQCIRKIASTGEVTTINADGNKGLKDASGNPSYLIYVGGLAYNKDDKSLYFTSYNEGVIKKVDLNGIVSQVAGKLNTAGFADGKADIARFNQPMGIRLSSKGEFYVADSKNYAIRKVLKDGTTTTISGNGKSGKTLGTVESTQWSSPNEIVLDTKENIYVAEYFDYDIKKIDFSGNKVESVSKISQAFFTNPGAMVVDKSGNLYFVNNGRSIKAFLTDGTLITVAENLHSIGGLAIDQKNNIYFTETNNSKIGKIVIGYK